MTNRPFFSVIIPCYNSSSTIITTLISLSEQAFKDFEVIIVDDNSNDSDNLRRVIREYSKNINIKVFFSEVKINGSGARNKGVELSSGEYIALLDSDDRWHSEKLLEYRDVILRSACISDKNIYYSSVNIVLDDKFFKKMPIRKFKKESETLASYIFGCAGFIQTSTLVLKRDDYLSVRFNDKFIRHQDYDFCIRAEALGYDFIYIDKPLTEYVMAHTSPQSKGETIKYSKFWIEEMKDYLKPSDVKAYNAFKLSKKLPTSRGVFLFLVNIIFCTYVVKLDLVKAIYSKFKKKFMRDHD